MTGPKKSSLLTTAACALLFILCGCAGRQLQPVQPDLGDIRTQLAVLKERAEAAEKRGEELFRALKSEVDAESRRASEFQGELRDVLRTMAAELSKISAAGDHRFAEFRAFVEAAQRRLDENLQTDGEQGALLKLHDQAISRLELRVAALEARCVDECSGDDSGAKPPDQDHFYEMAFLGLGSLAAICFGVLGLLFTMYAQFMAGVSLDGSTRPPLITGRIVWISWGVTSLILICALGGIIPLYSLAAPATLLAEGLRLVLALTLVGLAMSAFMMTSRMRVPRNRIDG